MLIGSSTPGGEQGDPLSVRSSRMFNGDGGFGSKSETSGDDSNTVFVNGGNDRDMDISDNASHFELTGKTLDSRNSSVQR